MTGINISTKDTHMSGAAAAPDAAFPFTLMRERSVDHDGNPVDDNDLKQWALVHTLEQSNVPPDVVAFGRGQMTVLSQDESAFVREKILMEVDPQGRCIRAHLRMDNPAQSRQPAMGDLVAVLLADGSAMMYEIIVAASDLDAAAAAHPLEPDAVVVISMPPGQAILQFRRDLGCIDPNAGADNHENTAGAAHAKH
jgi:hypothetical protein